MFKAPTERLQLYRRDQILSPARDLIRKNEFAQPSLGQIAKQAGLSPSIVSEYFAPKSENFDGCLAVNRETRAEEVAARVADTVNLKAPLPGFFKICHSGRSRSLDGEGCLARLVGFVRRVKTVKGRERSRVPRAGFSGR